MSAKRGPANNMFNGGLSSMEGRTICVHRDGKHWTLYSRALMEAHLGRELSSDEIVHHVNEDPSDDRVENYELLSRAEHLALHRSGHDRSRASQKAWATRRRNTALRARERDTEREHEG